MRARYLAAATAIEAVVRGRQLRAAYKPAHEPSELKASEELLQRTAAAATIQAGGRGRHVRKARAAHKRVECREIEMCTAKVAAEAAAAGSAALVEAAAAAAASASIAAHAAALAAAAAAAVEKRELQSRERTAGKGSDAEHVAASTAAPSAAGVHRAKAAGGAAGAEAARARPAQAATSTQTDLDKPTCARPPGSEQSTQTAFESEAGPKEDYDDTEDAREQEQEQGKASGAQAEQPTQTPAISEAQAPRAAPAALSPAAEAIHRQDSSTRPQPSAEPRISRSSIFLPQPWAATAVHTTAGLRRSRLPGGGANRALAQSSSLSPILTRRRAAMSAELVEWPSAIDGGGLRPLQLPELRRAAAALDAREQQLAAMRVRILKVCAASHAQRVQHVTL
jgi:SWI/SNF-related matrix-associated actin-dependent regulator 1 of chromatin subfamily A